MCGGIYTTKSKSFWEVIVGNRIGNLNALVIRVTMYMYNVGRYKSER